MAKLPQLSRIVLCFFVFSFLIAAPPASAQGKQEIRIAANAGPEGDAVRQLANAYSGGSVKVIELPYDTLREQLIAQLNRPQGTFDVVMIDDPWFPQVAGKLRELQGVPDDLRRDIVPASLRLGQNPYGIGPLMALPFVGNTEMLFIRTDLIQAMGIAQAPQDWQELADLARRITETSKNKLGHTVYGYAIRGHAGAAIVTDFLPIYWSFGGKLLDSNQSPRAGALDKPTFMKALKIYKVLAEASPPGALNYDWQDMTAAFASGRVAFEINWPTAIPTLLKSVAEKDGKRVWSVALPPGDNGPGTSMIGNWLLAVPKNVPEKRAVEAEKLIIWMLENQVKVARIIDPPTRISVFNTLANAPGADYFRVIREALERSTPRDRSPYWSQIENGISDAVSGYLVGTYNAEQATDLLDGRIRQLYPGY